MPLTVPENRPNTRFYTDALKPLVRPALTAIGFDDKGDPSKGYGFKQVLERMLQPESIQAKIADALLAVSRRALHPIDPSENQRRLVDRNSRFIQARAFVALTTLLLEHNHVSLSGWPSHQEALRRLTSALVNPPGGILLASELSGTHALELTFEFFKGEADPVKWVASLMNITRAMDLYLAIENAYQQYEPDEWANPDSTRLLSRDQKADAINRINASIKARITAMSIGGFGKSIDEIITGNWPLKVWFSVGYACMQTQQGNGLDSYPISRWLQRAITRCGGQAKQARKRYWSYQTSAHNEVAQRYWAEGPYYFHYVLEDAVAFWHAARAHDFLGYRQQTPVSDPFRSPWFLTPLDWLADISTPDGQTPPVDDGNKKVMYNTGFLSWDGIYGAEAIGKKFASITNIITAYPQSGSFQTYADVMNPNMMITQLAMPMSPLSDQDLRPPLLGNADPSQRHEHQLIFRKKIAGHTHYVYLHGETENNPISRGEGHEQPDQLQLLYYVDDQSYLIDPGYDSGSAFKNSSWNQYNLHNVMAFDREEGHNHGGIPSPHLDMVKIRKVSKHRPVNHLYYQQKGRLTVFQGDVRLTMGKGRKKNVSLYQRTVLIIEDDNAPYLIDLNSVTAEKNRHHRRQDYVMRYNGNANDFAEKPKPHAWNTWTCASKNLYCFFEPVEFDGQPYEVLRDFEVRESTEKNVLITSLLLASQNQPSFTTVGIFYVGKQMPEKALVPLIDYPSDARQRPAQAWAWLHGDESTLDVLVKRSKINKRSYQQPLTITVAEAGDKALTLQGGVDFGFVRLIRVDGHWQLHREYQWGLNGLAIV